MSTPSLRPRRRADAERNIARIVAAARACLSENPEATVDDIAAAAGVGRMTLYGHFKTRADLVEAAITEALRAGEATLSEVDLSGDARAALSRLLATSWALVAESAALLVAAQNVLPEGRIRDMHAEPANRVESLVRRGQQQGVFRTDLPMTWLLAAIQALLHRAGEEIRAGRLRESDAVPVITETVQSILAASNAAPRTHT